MSKYTSLVVESVTILVSQFFLKKILESIYSLKKTIKKFNHPKFFLQIKLKLGFSKPKNSNKPLVSIYFPRSLAHKSNSFSVPNFTWLLSCFLSEMNKTHFLYFITFFIKIANLKGLLDLPCPSEEANLLFFNSKIAFFIPILVLQTSIKCKLISSSFHSAKFCSYKKFQKLNKFCFIKIFCKIFYMFISVKIIVVILYFKLLC